MPRLGRQQGERYHAKLGLGLSGLEIRGADGGGQGHCQGLKQEAARGRVAVGGVWRSVKTEGHREEVGSTKGAMGKSQCQLGAGGQGEGALKLILFPGLIQFAIKTEAFIGEL